MPAYVLDTTALVARGLDRLLDTGKDGVIDVVVPSAVMQALEVEARADHPSGWVGLEEVNRLVGLRNEGRMTLIIAPGGPLHGTVTRTLADRAARQYAREIKETVLVTASRVQEALAKADGIPTIKVGGESDERLKVEELFDEETMSVHLREGMVSFAKKGRPGAVRIEKLGTTHLSRTEVMGYIVDTLETSRRSPQGFVEIEGTGATVVQFGTLRIGIAIPPFADAVEMTVVRPVARPPLEAYALPSELLERLEARAEGVIIAGSPGAGKSTFARALVELYRAKDKVVKTMESPRDLQVGEDVSQYGPLDGSFERTADILLLLRPDRTIFDELRRTEDFKIFADLRLAGVGMVGVTHSSSAIDAIQRFIGRVDLGMLPQIIDTVVFVRDGSVDEVYDVAMSVKVPHGMTESDLARPVIVVNDFFSREPRYEIYTFGDETAVVPVRPPRERDVRRIRERVLKAVGRMTGTLKGIQVEVPSARRAVVYAPANLISAIIGPKGRTVTALERSSGARIDVRPSAEAPSGTADISGPLCFRLKQGKRYWVLEFGAKVAQVPVDIVVGGRTLLSTLTDRKGRVKIAVRSPPGHRLIKASADGETVEAVATAA